MSMPRSACRRTTSLIAPGRTLWNSSSEPPSKSLATSAGRGNVPACDTRMRSVLRRMGVPPYCCKEDRVGMQDMSSRTRAAEAYVKALRTGEPSATQHASQYLAHDVVLATGQDEITGHDNVLKRITGQWPMTSVLVHAGFSAPREENGQVKVEAEVPPMGAAPQKLIL